MEGKSSVCKSSLKTGKRPEKDRTQDLSGPEISKTGRDRNRGPVYGPSQICKLENRKKTDSTGLDRSFSAVLRLFPSTKHMDSEHKTSGFQAESFQ